MRDATLPPVDDDEVDLDALPADATVIDEPRVVVSGEIDLHAAPTRAVTAATRALTPLPARRSPAAPVAVSAPAPSVVPVLAAAAAAPPPAPNAVLPAASAPPAPVRVPSAPAAPLPPLPFLVQSGAKAGPGRPPLPRGWKIALGVGGVVLLLVIVGNRGGQKPAPRLQVAGDVMVSEADLRRRKEVTAEYFRPKSGGRLPAPEAPRALMVPPPSAADVSAAEIEERRVRRQDDPSDLRRTRGRAGREPAPGAKDGSSTERQLYMPPPSRPAGTPARAGEVKTPGRLLAAAGASLAGVLETPVELSGGGSATVIVRLEDGELAGARLVGDASQSGGRVRIRFRTLLTEDGQEVDVRAEVRDTSDGGFGLAAGLSPPTRRESSPEAEVAEDTGVDLATGAIGGIGGSAVRDYTRRKRRGAGAVAPRPVIHLPVGEPVEVFLHESVREPPVSSK